MGAYTDWNGDPRILDPHLPGRPDALGRAERLTARVQYRLIPWIW
jgi:hypothetical protein